MLISIIVPFYDGNKYLNRLLTSVDAVAKVISESIEVIIVNDSPAIEVILPQTSVPVTVIANERNLGIQGARANGIRHSRGEFVILLDQDDELIPEGFEKQVILAENSDVVVGNGFYHMEKVNKKIYTSDRAMSYLIREKMFINIRNLIPSPGECMIRKKCIPDFWLNTLLTQNGADDWLLWLLLFKTKARFSCNPQLVYIHNDTAGGNLSADLVKMRESCVEMANLLVNNGVLTSKEFQRLVQSIDFKYKQDTHKLTLKDLVFYKNPLISNIIYRLSLNFLYG